MGTTDADIDLLTPREVAGLLKVTEQTLQRWRERGVGPKHVKLLSDVRYRRHDVVTYVAENVRASTQG
jgi:predicted site-specific integrase-resolvase